MADVVVVGSMNADLSAQVQRIPAPGETILARQFVRSPGGKGGNQAVGAARAGGARVAFVGAVGADDGQWLVDCLARDGIDVAGIERVNAPTGMALIAVDAAGENSIVVVAGANHAIDRLTDRQRGMIEGAKVVLAQLEIPLDAVIEAAQLTRESGGVFVLNAAPARELPKQLVDLVDVLVINEHEAREISGRSDLTEALAELGQRVGAVVLTLGGSGSQLLRRDHPPLSVAAAKVEVVDTTSAGDTYCGVLAAALAQGAEWDVALERASVASALAVTKRGAQDSIPTLNDIKNHLEGRCP